jgi:ribosome maturation factor RimP
VTGAEKIRVLAEPVAGELGVEVLDVELLGSGTMHVVRITQDSPAERAVTVADCETVSRRLTDVLDASEPIGGRYMLEVSSPGVDRPLKKPEHFRRVVGGRVRLRLVEPHEGARNWSGRLTAFDGEILTVETEDGRRLEVALGAVEKANFEYEFPDKQRPGRHAR